MRGRWRGGNEITNRVADAPETRVLLCSVLTRVFLTTAIRANPADGFPVVKNYVACNCITMEAQLLLLTGVVVEVGRNVVDLEGCIGALCGDARRGGCVHGGVPLMGYAPAF